MNTQLVKGLLSMIQYLSKLNPALAYYLDKLKIRNPVIYVITQLTMLITLVLFYLNVLNITDEIDTAIIGFITLLLSGISSSTYNHKEEYKKTTSNTTSGTTNPKERTGATKVEAKADAKVETKPTEKVLTFPKIDQSNN